MYKLNRLHELLMPWVIYSIPSLVLKDLKLNSQDVNHGDLFIAIKGYKTDGRLYIDCAIAQGAIAVLLESYNYNKSFSVQKIHNIGSVPMIYFNNLNQYISNIAGRFYGHPSLFVNLIGVTGTNGKTTITHLLANWAELIGEKSAVMGTLGYGMLDNLQPSSCTTYSAVDTQKILTQFIENNIKFISMEVSSHGLDQYRVDALYFDVAIFSNLSCDHLDYHGNTEKYEMAKWRFFHELCVKHYVINADDYIGNKWLLNLPDAVAVTIMNKLPNCWTGKWISLVKASYYMYGTDIIFNSSWGYGVIHTPLLGMFNVSNVLLALGALLIMGYPFKLLLNVSYQLRPICGRLEILKSYNQPTIIIDYAHTPDALEKVLSFIKSLYPGELWCVFGCGGDRDSIKRALMGLIVERYSNHIVITNDNPRFENPQLIINDILKGILHLENVKIIPDRICAIETAISNAQSEDCVLIFGKGHETYQIVGSNYISYSDQSIVKKFFDNNIS